MNMYMLARWLSINKISVIFLIIEQNKNCNNWVEHSNDNINSFLLFQKNCINAFGEYNQNTIWYTQNDYKYFLNTINNDNNTDIIIFKKEVLRNIMIVKYAFNLLNLLTKGANEEILKMWRLSISTNKESNFNNKYLAWNIRKSNVLINLNNTRNQIVSFYNFLKLNFPNYDILILSDQNGTDFVKQISIENNFHLSFSKDIEGNNSYLDDANLILKSNFYFQMAGGGMSTIAFFSNIPYLIFQKPSYEKESFKLGKLNWSLNNQLFVSLHHWSPENIKPFLQKAKYYIRNNINEFDNQ